MGCEDDVALIDALHRRGITPGNLLSIAITLLSAIGVIVGGAWTARGVLDEMKQQTVVLSMRLDADDVELKREIDTLRALNTRIDNLFDGRTHGSLVPPGSPSDFGDVTQPGPG